MKNHPPFLLYLSLYCNPLAEGMVEQNRRVWFFYKGKNKKSSLSNQVHNSPLNLLLTIYLKFGQQLASVVKYLFWVMKFQICNSLLCANFSHCFPDKQTTQQFFLNFIAKRTNTRNERNPFNVFKMYQKGLKIYFFLGARTTGRVFFV